MVTRDPRRGSAGSYDESLVRVQSNPENQILLSEYENQELLKGKYVGISGDDKRHIASHEKARTSDAYKRASSQGQIALDHHIQAHRLHQRSAGYEIIEE